MISKTMQNALNEQVNAEFYSAYLYLAMEAYFESISLPGFANWMRCQCQEEALHAMKFYDYINERNSRVKLSQIAPPELEWSSPLDAFEAAYKHEQKVTGLINDLVDLAIREGDHATNNFLQWFVAEQVEEEAAANAVVEKIKLAGTSEGALFQIDREMQQRVFTPPSAKSL